MKVLIPKAKNNSVLVESGGEVKEQEVNVVNEETVEDALMEIGIVKEMVQAEVSGVATSLEREMVQIEVKEDLMAIALV
ncbi:unnamed protein product [Linum trigynum]|uniref:Uncharacterized protein n=1 Tax=Linum trigynum TaxID=586398 RepID=A0AAV2D9N0_9ROSI